MRIQRFCDLLASMFCIKYVWRMAVKSDLTECVSTFYADFICFTFKAIELLPEAGIAVCHL